MLRIAVLALVWCRTGTDQTVIPLTGLVLIQTQGGLQDTTRTLNKQTAQTGITTPGDGAQMGLATAPVLARRNPQTGGELTTVPVLAGSSNRGDNGIGAEKSDSWTTAQSSYRRVTLALPSDLSFALGQAMVKHSHLLTDALRHQSDVLRIGVITFQFDQLAPDFGSTPFHDDARLRKQSADAVKQSGSLRPPSFPQAVPG